VARRREGEGERRQEQCVAKGTGPFLINSQVFDLPFAAAQLFLYRFVFVFVYFYLFRVELSFIIIFNFNEGPFTAPQSTANAVLQ